MDTSQSDAAAVHKSVIARWLIVAGAVVGFAVLALVLSGRADAAERDVPAAPDQSGVLGSIGHTVEHVTGPADRVLRPMTGTVHAVSAVAEPVVQQVAKPLEPVVSSVVRPIAKTVEPVLSVVEPVTAPVTRPVLHALAPVVDPVTHAVGADPVIETVSGHPVRTSPGTPRDDIGVTPVHGDATAVTPEPPQVPRPAVTVRTELGRNHGSGGTFAGDHPGSGGGGVPASPGAPGAVNSGGSVSAGSSGHGGEYAVSASGPRIAGTDRSWRAPPAGSWSLHWLEYYGNDHPS